MSTDSQTLIRAIALTQIKNIGPVTARSLISTAGSINNIFECKISELKNIPRINIATIKDIRSKENIEKAEKELEFINKHNIEVFLYYESNYPLRLKHCNDSPILFYSKGNTDFNAHKIINIVGTRNITEYGKKACATIIEGLVQHKCTIVSGLAFGVDSLAHKLALENKLPTIAVLGHSLDTIYPQENKQLAKNIISNGALVTEFSRHFPVDKSNFVRRNRIIAGMSDATIIIESAIKGGALITAEYANSYNRDVFAIPGKITDKYSQGCNRLIKTHKAAILESVDDIEYILNWEKEEDVSKKTNELFVETTDVEKEILNIFTSNEKVSIDVISNKSKLKINQVLSTLFNLEFKGLIKTYPGNMYGLN